MAGLRGESLGWVKDRHAMKTVLMWRGFIEGKEMEKGVRKERREISLWGQAWQKRRKRQREKTKRQRDT